MNNKYKLLKNMTKAELIETIYTIINDFDLWRCPKCGYFSPHRHVCWECRYDPTNIKRRTK